MKRKHNGIEFLRLLACISIILCHVPSNYGKISKTFGVCLFCIISGFMTSKNYRDDKNYLIKKLIKLAPLYYVVTIFTYIIAVVKPEYFNSIVPTMPKLIMSLLFIPFSQMGQTGYVYAIYPYGWYIVLQVWFYVIYYLLALLFKEKHDYFFIGLSLVALTLINILGIKNAITIQYPWFYLYMVIGVLLNIIFNKIDFEPKFKNNYTIQSIQICLFVVTLLIANDVSYFLNVILVIIMFVLSYTFDFDTKLNKLCSCTYEVYLTHQFVVALFNRVLPKIININNGSILIQIIVIVISLLIGYLVSIPNKEFTYKLKNLLIREA